MLGRSLLRALSRRASRQRSASKSFTNTTEAQQQWHHDTRGYQHFQRRGNWLEGRAPIVLVGAAGISAYVYFSSLQEIPYSHRKHAILVSTDMERDLGVRAFQQIVMEAKSSGTLLPQSHPATQLIRRIGKRVVAQALENKGGGFTDHMKGLDWEFVVIQRPDPNAMVVPGGKVVVHTGLLDLMRTEDEIAAVLSHEVAHVLSRHIAEKLSQTQLTEVARSLVYWTLGVPIPQIAAHALVFLPNSRKVETEADLVGMQIAAQACYDPAAFVPVFEKLGQAEAESSTSTIPGFLRTHPLSAKRVKRVQEELPKARNTYELSGCSTVVDKFRGYFP